MKLTKYLLIVFAVLTSFKASAQEQRIKSEIELQTGYTTNKIVPFWMRSNRFGSVPLSGLSGSFLGRIEKDYKPPQSQQNYDQSNIPFDWGFGIEARVNGGKGSNIKLIQAYLKAKYSIFQVKAGRTKDVMGLTGDTTLTSGSYSVSGNALGIPSLNISIPEYFRLKMFNGLFSFKGNFSNGYVGDIPIHDTIYSRGYGTHARTLFHQASLYGRLGREDQKFKIYGGFNHNVFWGDEKYVYRELFPLSKIESFLYAVTGKGLTTKEISKVGNHMGSIDLGFEYEFENFKMLIYRQNIYESGALYYLSNIRDGLNGITFTNTNIIGDGSFQWKKALFELFYTRNQGGETWSRYSPSGDENYYNHGTYKEGWSYNSVGIGNPFITPQHDARAGLTAHPINYFVNNRVVAFHLGLEASAFNWDYRTKLSFSRNYGTFATTSGMTTTGIRDKPIAPYFETLSQFSAMFEATRAINRNYKFGYSLFVDHGKLVYNSTGVSLKFIRSF